MLTTVKWVLLCGLVFVVTFPMYGLVIAYEWDWFVGPIIGARQITLAQGVGLCMFISAVGAIVAIHLRNWEAIEGDLSATLAAGLVKMIEIGLVAPLAGLGGAWTWHAFFM